MHGKVEIGGTSQSMIPFEAQRKPTEYGKIIKWREGEILGLGSSSIVYSAINTKDNSMIAVKKFKIVSDVTGIDQNKLKIVKVSRINLPIELIVNRFVNYIE